MCTRFYILPGSPDLEYIVKTAEKSPLLRRFVHNRMSKIMPGSNPDKRDRMIAQQLSFINSDFGGASAASSAQNNVNADKAGSTSELLSISGEIRPTNIVPVLAPDKNGNAAVFPMEWGFRLPAESGNAGTPPSLQKSGRNSGRISGQIFGHSAKGKLLVNARSETAAVKASFREAWACRRCIIPASWYYEWEHFTDENGRKKAGRKFAIRPVSSSMQDEMSVSAVSAPAAFSPDKSASEIILPEGHSSKMNIPKRSDPEKFLSVSSGHLNILAETVRKASSVTWLCGLYRIENNVPVFVVLTREPGRELSRIHDRMPLILPPDAALEWVRPQAKPEDLLKYSLTEMEIREAH